MTSTQKSNQMGLNNSNGSSSKYSSDSYKHAKKASPRVQSAPAPKSSNISSQLRDGLRLRESHLDRKHMKKSVAVYPISEIKDIEIEKKLNFDEVLPKKTDWFSLSSGRKSPPLLKFDNLQDLPELDCWNISLQEQFSSILSLSETSGRVPMFGGSRVNPIDDASLVLDRPCVGCLCLMGSRVNPIDDASLVLDRPCCDIGRKHFQEKVNTWLHKMDGNKVTDSCFVCLESGSSSYATSFFEESSVFESSCTSFTTYDSSPSFVQEFDRADIWASLLDLETDDSKLIDDGEHGFDTLGSDFPSPFFSDKRKFMMKPSTSGSVQIEQAKSLSENCTTDEPLFWPFDDNSYLSPELDNFSCISPCKDRMNLGRKQINRPNSIRSRLDDKTSSPVVSKNMQRCRKTLFSSTPDTHTLNCREKFSNKIDVKKTPRSSSLSKLTQILDRPSGDQ